MVAPLTRIDSVDSNADVVAPLTVDSNADVVAATVVATSNADTAAATVGAPPGCTPFLPDTVQPLLLEAVMWMAPVWLSHGA